MCSISRAGCSYVGRNYLCVCDYYLVQNEIHKGSYRTCCKVFLKRLVCRRICCFRVICHFESVISSFGNYCLIASNLLVVFVCEVRHHLKQINFMTQTNISELQVFINSAYDVLKQVQLKCRRARGRVSNCSCIYNCKNKYVCVR